MKAPQRPRSTPLEGPRQRPSRIPRRITGAPQTTHNASGTSALSTGRFVPQETSRPSHLSDRAGCPLDCLTPRTLRLSDISTEIDEAQFRQYLACLSCRSGTASEIRGFSLEPYRGSLMATVSFSSEPVAFSKCRPRSPISVELPRELGGKSFTVDCDFYGITTLHYPSDPEYDLVAVSGLSSHAFGSWKSPLIPHEMWLRDFLKDDIPNCRVFIWGYDSELQESFAKMSIRDYARRLLLAIQGVREGDSNALRRPIIFVGHSLGGLIIKQALVEASRCRKSSRHDEAILGSCVGLFLFGVPNKGLNEQNILSMVKGTQKAPFVASLREGSDLLDALHAEFQHTYDDFLSSCYVVCFYETKDTPVAERTPEGEWKRNSSKLIRMVTKESAIGGASQVTSHNQIPIDLDHSKLVKFTARNDHNYSAVCSKIKELIEMLSSRQSSNQTSAGELHAVSAQAAHDMLRKRLETRHRRSRRIDPNMSKGDDGSGIIRSVIDGIKRWFSEPGSPPPGRSSRISESRAPPTLPVLSDTSLPPILKAQSTSRMLYQALLNCGPCNCHEVHMRLEPALQVMEADPQPPPQFSMLLDDKVMDTSTIDRHMQLNIVQESPGLTATRDTLATRGAIKLCAADPDTNGDSNVLEGFLVHRSYSEVRGTQKSLKQLLNSKLNLAEKLDLGVKLGSAAIYFHSSPWIRSWDTETVNFFISPGSHQSAGSWTPYVLSDFIPQTPETQICDIYLLGLMLLEIAGRNLGEFQKTKSIRGRVYPQLNWRMVSDLYREFGVPYKNVVEAFLEIGLLAGDCCVSDKDIKVLFEAVQDLSVFAMKFCETQG